MINITKLTRYNIYESVNGERKLLYENMTSKEVSEAINIKRNVIATRATKKNLVSNRYYIERVEQPFDDTIYSIVDIYNKIKSNKGTKYKIEFVLERE